METSARSNMWLFTPDSIIEKPLVDTLSFFNRGANISIEPVLITEGQDYFVGIILLGLILFISFVWYFSPDLLANNFKSFNNFSQKRNWESSGNKSGLLVNSLLYLNFLIVVSLLILMMVNNLLPDYLNINLAWNSLYLIILFIVVLVVIRYLVVKLSGFIFKTFEMGLQQNRLYSSMEKALGLILLPLLLFSLYTPSKVFLYIGIIIFILFAISRWVFTIVIGMRVSKFNWFHIILYLCTLEIIPLMLLIKVLKGQVFGLL